VARLALALLLAVISVLAVYSRASAHVTLVSSSPAANSRLEASPPRIRLEFSETVEPSMASISIARADGQTIPVRLIADPRDAHVVFADVGDLGAGSFRVTWRVVSADSHPVSGSFIFTVGVAIAVIDSPSRVGSDGAASTSRMAPTVLGLLRGIGVGAVAGLAGVLSFGIVFGASRDENMLKLAKRLAAAGSIVLVAHLLTWLASTSPDADLNIVWTETALSSTVGRLELWRTLFALAPVWALFLARQPVLACILCAPSLMLSAAIGHSAAFHPALAIPLKALHLASLSAWLGGLLWLDIRRDDDPVRLVHEAQRVSFVALAAVVVIALSGIVQTIIVLLPAPVLRSTYALVVAAKVIGFLVLVLFGAHHRFRVLPRIAADAASRSQLRISLRRELAVFWAVVVLGGVLAYTSPPNESGGQPESSTELHR
jgi:copper transport protein